MFYVMAMGSYLWSREYAPLDPLHFRMRSTVFAGSTTFFLLVAFDRPIFAVPAGRKLSAFRFIVD